MERNVLLLSACNFCGLLALFVNVAVSDIIGKRMIRSLNAQSIYSSLPFGVLVVSAAVIVGVSGIGAKKFGYKIVFSAGAIAGFLGGSVCLIASVIPETYPPPLSLTLFTAGAALQGSSYAVTNYYRHAAAVTSDADESSKSRSVSSVVSVGVLAALAGPGLAIALKALVPQRSCLYLLAFVTVVHAAHALLVLPLKITEARCVNCEMSTLGSRRRNLTNVDYVHACLTGTVGHGVMMFCMAVTPLTLRDKVDAAYVSAVICAHAICMFLPSFLADQSIRRFGAGCTAFFGNLIGAIGVGLYLINASGNPWCQYAFIATSMVLVGFAWNLVFISATALLAGSYEAENRFVAQAFNDTCLLGLGGGLALSAGFLLENDKLKYAVGVCIGLYVVAASCNFLHTWKRFRKSSRSIVPLSIRCALNVGTDSALPNKSHSQYIIRF